MRNILTKPVNNQLISSLPAEFRAEFIAQCTLASMDAGDVVGANEIDATHAYFPLDGIVSLRVRLASRKSLDVAMIGNEGMYGTPLWLGGRTNQFDGLVRQSGCFLRMDLPIFQQQLDQIPELRITIGIYTTTLLEQMAQTAACVCFHDVQSRLATFLLMTQDRIQRDVLQLTHHCVADIMGVRRSAISVAAGILQTKQLIRYARGQIHLVSREGMESAACECYGVARRSV